MKYICYSDGKGNGAIVNINHVINIQCDNSKALFILDNNFKLTFNIVDNSYSEILDFLANDKLSVKELKMNKFINKTI